MRKLFIFALFLLSACSSTKQEISPLVQKKYYKVIVMDLQDSTSIKESKIVEL
jgi:uncharacterized protein YcfL